MIETHSGEWFVLIDYTDVYGVAGDAAEYASRVDVDGEYRLFPWAAIQSMTFMEVSE